MTATTLWPWIAALALGAVHGINPGMGWLFAVALGLQEGKGRAVWRALPPLALGHALAIAAAVSFAAIAGQMVPLETLKWAVAITLLVFGLYRLFRHRHPRWGGMQVGSRDLAVWSFLMASAHGAGLMVLPIALGGGAAPTGDGAMTMAGSSHAGHGATLMAGAPGADAVAGLAITLVHTVGYLAIAGALAAIVYSKLGLRSLRSLWLNIDLIWAIALVLTALATPFI